MLVSVCCDSLANLLAFFCVALQEAPYVFHGDFADYERDVQKRGGDAGVELTMNSKNSN